MITSRIVCQCGEVYYLVQPGTCWRCKANIAPDSEFSPDGFGQSVELRRVSGPELWAKLHSYRWTNYAEFRDWFDLWLAEVDKLPGCSCSQDFRSSILPQFADRFGKIQHDGDWFTLTWEIHNAVNLKLGKREWSLDEAQAKRGEL